MEYLFPLMPQPKLKDKTWWGGVSEDEFDATPPPRPFGHVHAENKSPEWIIIVYQNK
jgi:hypothetical protein